MNTKITVNRAEKEKGKRVQVDRHKYKVRKEESEKYACLLAVSECKYIILNLWARNHRSVGKTVQNIIFF